MNAMKYGSYLGLMVLMAGCATAIRGARQGMEFKTFPQQATVAIDGKEYATPAKVELKRNKAHEVAISAPGHRTVQFRMVPQWDGMALGNVIMPGGSLGMATDTVNGADKAFYQLGVIQLPELAAPDEPPLVLYQWKGKLLTRQQYDAAVLAERLDRTRFFGME